MDQLVIGIFYLAGANKYSNIPASPVPDTGGQILPGCEDDGPTNRVILGTGTAIFALIVIFCPIPTSDCMPKIFDL